MELKIALIISVVLVLIGWYLSYTKYVHWPFLVNIFMGTLSLIYIIIEKKFTEWILLPTIWYAGIIIPIILCLVVICQIDVDEQHHRGTDY